MGVLLYSQSSRQYSTRTCETSEYFIRVFWDVTLCHCMSSLWHFEELHYLHLLDQACQEEYLTPNVKMSRFFKMLGTTRQIKWCHVPKDFDLQQHCFENPIHCVQILNWTKQGCFPEPGLQICTYVRNITFEIWSVSAWWVLRLQSSWMWCVVWYAVVASFPLLMPGTILPHTQPNLKYSTVPAFARKEWGKLKVPYITVGRDWNLGTLVHKVTPCCSVSPEDGKLQFVQNNAKLA